MARGFRAIKNKDKLILKAKKLLAAGKKRGVIAEEIGVSELTLRRWLLGVGVAPGRKGRSKGPAIAVGGMPNQLSPTGRVGKRLLKGFLDAIISWAKAEKAKV
jgi:hypothetical protein